MKRSLKVWAAAAALTVAGGGVAFAFFTDTASGTANATTANPTGDVDVSVSVTGDPLSPAGPAQTISWTATNNSTNSVTLTRVDIEMGASDELGNLTAVDPDPTAADPSCTIYDYEFLDSTGTSWWGAGATFSESISEGTLAPEGTVSGTAKIRMIDTGINQNACKGVSVPFLVTVG